MPELPDVEARARNLRNWMNGRRILNVLPPEGARQRAHLPPGEFARRIRGRKVLSVDRKGKWILLRLSGDAGVAIHLGMTGDFSHDDQRRGPRLARAHFGLDDRNWVHYVDPRRFGKIIVAKTYEDLIQNPALSNLGPDALSELKSNRLREVLARSSRPIKEVLMDQHAMTGIGNVYATEALWLAKIHPAQPAKKVSRDPVRIRKLLQAVRTALKRGLQAYDRGKDFEPKVYGRAALPCPRCGTRLKSIVLGQRSSAFCPVCQRE